MRIVLRLASAIVFVGAIGGSLTGCTAHDVPLPLSPTSTATSPTADAIQDETAASSEFEQQLPLSGEFVSQWAQTAGSVVIARRDDGTVWVALSNFRTGPSPDLRIYLNEGALVKDADGVWSSDAGMAYEIGAVSDSDSTQEFKVPGSRLMSGIHSVTVMENAGPDYRNFGSAALG